MDKVLVRAKIENLEDSFAVHKGLIKPEEARSIEVTDALADTGASTLMLPKRFISRLGLRYLQTRPARGLGGSLKVAIYSAVRLTIEGRNCTLDVAEIDDRFPVLIGQIPLEMLDWVVDPIGQRLIGNPEHAGEETIDVFCSRMNV